MVALTQAPPAIMKLLFVFNHALYLRNYGDVLAALAGRGHDVEVAFTVARPGDTELFRRVFAADGGVSLVDAPTRTGWWWAAIDPVRALRDFIHYLQPAFDGAPRLVERASRRVPRLLQRLVGRRGGGAGRRRFFERLLAAIERCVPADPGIDAWLRNHPADAVLFSPLIEFNYEQTHILKAARRRGLRTGHLVASWDNLSNKGRIQIQADSCLVWNRFQEREAIELHGYPAGRIAITGAQLYDHWFAMTARQDRATFCASLGLDAAQPIILYACSSPFICPDEVAFVTRWLTALRSAPESPVRSAQVILRPHPVHAAQWRQADFSALGPIVISPQAGAAPIEAADRQFFYDTLTHSAAVVGVNTSVFLEAGILGRPCLAVRSAEFDASQTGTLHFRYLVDGRLLRLSTDMSAHTAALAAALAGSPPPPESRRFVEEFLRPLGIDRPAVPIMVEAIERLGVTATEAERPPVLAPLVRALFWPLAALYLRPRYLARRARRAERRLAETAAGGGTSATQQSRP